MFKRFFKFLNNKLFKKPERNLGDFLKDKYMTSVNEITELYGKLEEIASTDDSASEIERKISTLLKQEPTIYYNANDKGIFTERKTWFISIGCLFVIDKELTEEETERLKLFGDINISLEEEMGIAISNEDYEKCALIRDKMNSENKIENI